MTLADAFNYVVGLRPPMSKDQLDDITHWYEYLIEIPEAAWMMIWLELMRSSPPVTYQQILEVEELYNQ